MIIGDDYSVLVLYIISVIIIHYANPYELVFQGTTSSEF